MAEAHMPKHIEDAKAHAGKDKGPAEHDRASAHAAKDKPADEHDRGKAHAAGMYGKGVMGADEIDSDGDEQAPTGK